MYEQAFIGRFMHTVDERAFFSLPLSVFFPLCTPHETTPQHVFSVRTFGGVSGVHVRVCLLFLIYTWILFDIVFPMYDLGVMRVIPHTRTHISSLFVRVCVSRTHL